MEGSLTDLSKYRLDTALEDLRTSKMLFDAGAWKASLNRSYYAIFHALRSVTALDRFDAKKHSSVISYFNRQYVKSGIFDVNTSSLIDTAFRMRGNADYQDFYTVSKEDTQQQIYNAEKIIAIIQPYLEERWRQLSTQS